jgi:hypothetical protein
VGLKLPTFLILTSQLARIADLGNSIWPHILFIHSSVAGDLRWFYSLAKVYSTATSIGVQVFLSHIYLYSFGAHELYGEVIR